MTKLSRDLKLPTPDQQLCLYQLGVFETSSGGTWVADTDPQGLDRSCTRISKKENTVIAKRLLAPLLGPSMFRLGSPAWVLRFPKTNSTRVLYVHAGMISLTYKDGEAARTTNQDLERDARTLIVFLGRKWTSAQMRENSVRWASFLVPTKLQRSPIASGRQLHHVR